MLFNILIQLVWDISIQDTLREPRFLSTENNTIHLHTLVYHTDTIIKQLIYNGGYRSASCFRLSLWPAKMSLSCALTTCPGSIDITLSSSFKPMQ